MADRTVADRTVADRRESPGDTTVDGSTVDVEFQRMLEFGQPEPVDVGGHPRLVALGLILILALVGLGVAGLANSLGTGQKQAVDQVVVPRAAGRPVADVQKQLEQIGLIVEIAYASNEVAPIDTVISQSPIAGSRIAIGELVTVTVSDGPAGVKIPDVASLQPGAASALLQAVGLGATVEQVFDEEVRVGEVVASDPEVGSRASIGSSVKLLVSKGPKPRAVPQVVGLEAPRAMAEIARSDLKIGDVDRRVTTDQAPGTVISSSPQSGTEAARATPVDLVIAIAAKRSTVPDVVGMTREAAARAASESGVRIVSTTESVPAGDTRSGVVLRQNLIAGTVVDIGTQLSVVVGSAPAPMATVPDTTEPPSGD